MRKLDDEVHEAVERVTVAGLQAEHAISQGCPAKGLCQVIANSVGEAIEALRKLRGAAELLERECAQCARRTDDGREDGG